MLFCTWKYQPTVQICRPSHSLFHISRHSCKLQNNRSSRCEKGDEIKENSAKEGERDEHGVEEK